MAIISPQSVHQLIFVMEIQCGMVGFKSINITYMNLRPQRVKK
jgi:hypothetical protein